MTQTIPPTGPGFHLDMDPELFGKRIEEIAEMRSWVAKNTKGDVRYSFTREIRDLRTDEPRKLIGFTVHFADEGEFGSFRERYA